MPADPALDPAAAGAVDPVTGMPIEGAAGGGLAGEGWIVELRGYHLHNSLDEPKVDLRGDEGWEFVQNTLIKNLEDGTVKLPDGPNGEPIEVPIKDLGIKYPVILTFERIKKEIYLPEAVDDSADGSVSMPTTSYRGRGGEDRRHDWRNRHRRGNRRGQNVDVAPLRFSSSILLAASAARRAAEEARRRKRRDAEHCRSRNRCGRHRR